MSLGEFIGWFVLVAGEQSARKLADRDPWRPWGDEEFELYRKLRNESHALRERLTPWPTIRVPVQEAELPRPEWDE